MDLTNDSKKYDYFAYGSNLDVQAMKQWWQNKGENPDEYEPVVLYPAVLNGYRLSFNYYSKGGWNAGAANIMRSNGDQVYGLLMHIDEKERDILRTKEGVPGGAYYELSVPVFSFPGEEHYHKALTYKVMADREEQELQLPASDYMKILLEAAERYMFPRDYRAYLRSIPTLTPRLS